MMAEGEQGEALLQFESEQPILDLLDTYGLPLCLPISREIHPKRMRLIVNAIKRSTLANPVRQQLPPQDCTLHPNYSSR